MSSDVIQLNINSRRYHNEVEPCKLLNPQQSVIYWALAILAILLSLERWKVS